MMKGRLLLFKALFTVLFFGSAVPARDIADPDFKKEQLRYPNVKQAFKDKEALIDKLLQSKNLKKSEFELLLVAFKHEAVLEAWGRPPGKKEEPFVLLRSFDICASSGDLGPKRKEGDSQVPEGFYHVSYFNPKSDYFVSLGVSYPNESDRILSDQRRPGGMIAIHGDCVTIGCLPLTDDKMKELYILAVEARNGGQEKIPVHIYPFRMTKENFKKITPDYPSKTVKFWENIRTMYDYFEKNKNITYVGCDRNGAYVFE